MGTQQARLILLGPPGAGKGTQSALLSERLCVPHISTGEILRAEVSHGSEVGVTAKQFMDRGELVPDAVMLSIIRERLSGPNCRAGFLLDGFPRSVAQATGLEEIMRSLSITGVPVVSLAVPSSELVRRLSGRRTCKACGAMFHEVFEPPARPGTCDRCGGELYQRVDDREEIVRARLEVYRKQTEPVLSFYGNRGALREIDGTGQSSEVFGRLMAALDGVA